MPFDPSGLSFSCVGRPQLQWGNRRRYGRVNGVLGRRENSGCLPFRKKFRKFRSERTVRVVYHLAKISVLSRRARLGSSFSAKKPETGTKHEMVNGKRISGKTGLPFQAPVCTRNFLLLFSRKFPGTNQRNVYHSHPNRNFREFVVNGQSGAWTTRMASATRTPQNNRFN